MNINHLNRILIAQGRTAEVYDWDEGHILKLYHTWCPPSWVEHEARVARAISKAGIPAPAAGEIIDMDGRRGIIYDRVNGISMLDELRRRPWLLWQHARTLAGLQVKVHHITVAGLQSYHKEVGHSIQRTPYLSDLQRAKVLGILSSLPDGQNLLHGDFHPGNVLVMSNGAVIIDWMTASLGSSLADVARTSMLLTIGVKTAGNVVSPLLRLFSGLFHRAYLNRYFALMPGGKDEYKQWLPVIAAARLEERIETEREALLQLIPEEITF